MAAALVVAFNVVLFRRVTRCEGLYEPEPMDNECEFVREYALRFGRLEAMDEIDERCGLDGRGVSCLHIALVSVGTTSHGVSVYAAAYSYLCDGHDGFCVEVTALSYSGTAVQSCKTGDG